MDRSMEDDVPRVPQTLREMTEEDEKRLMVLEEEEQFKSALHSKFLVGILSLLQLCWAQLSNVLQAQRPVECSGYLT